MRKATTMEMYLMDFLENMPIILRQNEKLIKAVRRHKLFLLPVFFGWPLIIVALFAVRYVVNFNFFGYWGWTLTFALLMVALTIFYKYYIWRNKALIITNQRVVENEQRGFFSKTVTELLYRDIREISYSKDGMNASVYDYGDLKMRTAADSDIIIEKIAEPDETVELINQMRQSDKLSGPDRDNANSSMQPDGIAHV